MKRQPPDLAPALSAFYAKRFPTRPPKHVFDDEILALADFVWAQIDIDGERAVKYPPGYAEGVMAEPSAKPSGKRGVRHVD